mgnify:FL=1
MLFIIQAILSYLYISSLYHISEYDNGKSQKQADYRRHHEPNFPAEQRKALSFTLSEHFNLSDPCTKTVHSWSLDLLKRYNIPCGLISIKRLAEDEAASNSTSTEMRALLNRFHGEIKHNYDHNFYHNNGDLQRLRKINQSKILANWRKASTNPSNPKVTVYKVRRSGRLDDRPKYRTKLDTSMVPAVSFTNVRAKSLAFVKPYKVGGTTVASLLTYLYNLEIGSYLPLQERLDPEFNATKDDKCVDIVGNDHPPKSFYGQLLQFQNDFGTVGQNNGSIFCRNVTKFMIVRNPMDRLWSGYQHARRYLRTLTLPTFLQQKRSLFQVSQAPHMMLSDDVSQALKMSEKLLMLVSDKTDMMDMSLMLLSLEAGMSICDVIHEPCSPTRNLSTSKCDHEKTKIPMQQQQLLQTHTSSSGEIFFYYTVFQHFQRITTKNTALNQRLERYRNIREKALERCGRDTAGYIYADIFLMLDPRVQQMTDGGTKRWVLKGENQHSLDPTWLCMQWFSHKWS